MSKTLLDNITNIYNQKNTYLVPGNIKNGVQIFDIVGTYDSGGSNISGVKMFPNVNTMQADPTAQLDDLAIVYNNTSNNFEGIYKCNNSITKFSTFINDDITVDTTNNTITIIPSSTFQVDKSIIKKALLKFEETYNISGLTFGIYTPINNASTLFLGCIAYKNKDTGVFLGYFRDKADYNIYNNKNILAMWSKYSGIQQYYPVQFEYDINTDTITQSVLVPSFEESDHIGIDVTLYNCLGSFVLNEDTLEFKSEFNYYPVLNSAPTISTTFNDNFPVYQLVYEYAPTQFTVTSENIYNATAFGQNGLINGTLQETTNLTKDQVVTRVQVYSDLSTLNILNIASVSAHFFSNINPTYLPNMNFSNFTHAASLFENCYNLKSIGTIYLHSANNAAFLFANCYNLTTIPNFDTSNIKYTTFMFGGCTNLISIPNFDTSNVNIMWSTFTGCRNLITVPNFDTSNATDMKSMFADCTNLVTVPNFNLSKAQNVSGMFINCRNLTAVPNFDTSRISNTTSMFSGCTNLTSIPQFNFSSTLNTTSMFVDCVNLVDFPLIHFNSMWKASGMFRDCPNLSPNAYSNIANGLPNASVVYNQNLKYLGLNVNNFSVSDLTVLNAKGYVDAIIPEPTAQTYYHIEWT